jgi:hypothetical protein
LAASTPVASASLTSTSSTTAPEIFKLPPPGRDGPGELALFYLFD